MLDATVSPSAAPARRHPARDPAAPSNAVAAVLTPADVVVDVDASTKSHVLEAISRFIAMRHDLDGATVLASLTRREAIGSTGLGNGLAIPHARVAGLASTFGAFVRTRDSVEFDAPDGKPVSDFLVLLVPKHATEAHLELLAEAAQMLCDAGFLERLRGAADAAEVHAAFAGWE